MERYHSNPYILFLRGSCYGRPSYFQVFLAQINNDTIKQT